MSRNTLRNILKAGGLSWKKCKKLLAKAKPEERERFVEKFQALYARMCNGEVAVTYLDEVHIHQDMEVAYSWSPMGEDNWVISSSPGLSQRINWFGAYNFTDGDCFIWENGACNSENCMRFLDQLAEKRQGDQREIVLIWDGASYHRSRTVRAYAEKLGFTILSLPGYSPDLNPIEGLWKWMREEVTQHYCHQSLDELRQSCLDFIDDICRDPEQVVTRLWPHFDLDPDVEKLRFSN